MKTLFRFELLLQSWANLIKMYEGKLTLQNLIYEYLSLPLCYESFPHWIMRLWTSKFNSVCPFVKQHTGPFTSDCRAASCDPHQTRTTLIYCIFIELNLWVLHKRKQKTKPDFTPQFFFYSEVRELLSALSLLSPSTLGLSRLNQCLERRRRQCPWALICDAKAPLADDTSTFLLEGVLILRNAFDEDVLLHASLDVLLDLLAAFGGLRRSDARR